MKIEGLVASGDFLLDTQNPINPKCFVELVNVYVANSDIERRVGL